jgi:hypothetical protein
MGDPHKAIREQAYLRLSTTYHGKKVDGFFGGVGQMSF